MEKSYIEEIGRLESILLENDKENEDLKIKLQEVENINKEILDLRITVQENDSKKEEQIKVLLIENEKLNHVINLLIFYSIKKLKAT